MPPKVPCQAVTVLAVALLSAGLGVGCSSSGPRTAGGSPAGRAFDVTEPPRPVSRSAAASIAAPSTTLPLAGFAARYLAIVKPADDAFDTADSNGGTNTTAAQAAAIFAPVATATAQADNELLRVAWPTSMIDADVHALVAADDVVVADLHSLGQQTPASQSGWLTQFATDDGAAHAAANLVRTDLGLPASS